MREVKHLTSGTPNDKMNVNPVWSPDGKSIAYTQEQAKGTDSNIFVAELTLREKAGCSLRIPASIFTGPIISRQMARVC